MQQLSPRPEGLVLDRPRRASVARDRDQSRHNEDTVATHPGRDESAWLSPRSLHLVRLVVLLGIATAIGLAYLVLPAVRAELGRAVSILASGDGIAIGDYLRSYGVWAPIASLGLMVIQAVAAPVPAVLVAFANGLTFGVFWGGLLTIAGQTLAAIVCFWIARVLGRGPVEALAGKFGLEAADAWFTRWGGRGILLLRLIPGISFDVISYAAGLTGMRFGPFVLATAIGVAPQAFLYAYLIREAPQSAWIFYVATWLIIGGIAAAAFLRGRRSPTKTEPGTPMLRSATKS